jgi:hypothetical protein
VGIIGVMHITSSVDTNLTLIEGDCTFDDVTGSLIKVYTYS